MWYIGCVYDGLVASKNGVQPSPLICFGCSWAYATPPKTPCAIKNGASMYLGMLYTQRGDPRMVCRCQYARPRPTEKQEGLHIVEDVKSQFRPRASDGHYAKLPAGPRRNQGQGWLMML